MDKQMVAALLKKHRADSRLTVAEVIQKLKAKNVDISEKTLYGYERGTSTPNVPIFIALCDIYNINDIISESSGSNQLTKIEKATASNNGWTFDQYNDFFNADIYGKIYLLQKDGVPSFDGYMENLSSLFPSSADKANYDKLYAIFVKLDERVQEDLIEQAEFKASKQNNLKEQYRDTPTHSAESAG